MNFYLTINSKKNARKVHVYAALIVEVIGQG